jgi:hypothetical protein
MAIENDTIMAVRRATSGVVSVRHMLPTSFPSFEFVGENAKF